jgi:hypothetical protein
MVEIDNRVELLEVDPVQVLFQPTFNDIGEELAWLLIIGY